MRIFVGVKRVVDYAVKVRVKPDKSAVDIASVTMSINPFCEIAVEEAVRLKEKKIATEVTAVSVGPKPAAEVLRKALALGADKAIHIEADMRTDQELQPLAVAKILAWVTRRDKPDAWLLGKQAIDDDANQTGQMLAGLLDWPQVTFASKVTVADDRKSVTVTREIDGGLQTLSAPLPAVLTADLRLNTPRFTALPNIIAARKKPLEVVPLASTGVDAAPRLKVLEVSEPPKRKAGKAVKTVDELVAELKTAGVV